MASRNAREQARKDGIKLGSITKYRRDVRVGDTVTCRYPEQAYYSGYAGRPECVFTPGMEGVVGAIHVPTVTGPDGVEFICVDFTHDAGAWSPSWAYDDEAMTPEERDRRERQRMTWRVGLYYDNIEVVRKGEIL